MGLGIPGLDESYLPRWIGYGFGSLLLLNHFVGSNSAAPITSAQLVSNHSFLGTPLLLGSCWCFRYFCYLMCFFLFFFLVEN